MIDLIMTFTEGNLPLLHQPGGTVYLLCYGLDNRGSGFWFPVVELFSSPLLA